MTSKRGRPILGTDDLALRAQKYRTRGLTVRAIAARLGISKSLVGELIHVDFEAKRQAARDLKAEQKERELDGMRVRWRTQMEKLAQAQADAQSTYSSNAPGWS
jgi:transposase